MTLTSRLPHFALLSAWLLLAHGCGQAPTLVEAIRNSGELRIALLTVAPDETVPESYAGFDYDLGGAFAAWLEVSPRFIFARDYQHLRALVAQGKAHIGAALLPLDTTAADANVGFGPSYAIVRQLVIHRRGQPRPKRAADLLEWRGATLRGPGMRVMQSELPRAAGYHWAARDYLALDDILRDVENGVLDYAVLPSFDFDAARRNYPELQIAFELGGAHPVAWLYRLDSGNSLWQTQLDFLKHARASGDFALLYDRHFGHIKDFDYVASRDFLRHYRERLPALRAAFKDSGARIGIDWRLLAALSYQESHWQSEARSTTGVRGLMMLTRRTAKLLGVDRLDALESIDGGARYLQRMREHLPARIAEPDRTWLALAAYNIGIAHLEDARVFAAQAGLDADRWANVRSKLPQLSTRTGARKARHGAARGAQAVHFVRNVRRYYDVLRWLENPAANTAAPPAQAPQKLISPAL